MGYASSTAELLRKRIRAERENHGWSQEFVANAMSRFGFHASTVAKIEVGQRCVRADELSALADLFNVSTDTLLERRAGAMDAAWSAEKLAGTSQKIAMEISALKDRLINEVHDVRFYAERDNQFRSTRDLLEAAELADRAMSNACEALLTLADQFPLIGAKRS
jgi:transcriptional regulator with XRE-family HTH domain